MQPIEFGPLDELIDPASVGAQAVKHLSATKERFPSEQQAREFVEKAIARHVSAAVAASVLPKIENELQEAYDGFELVEDSRPEDATAASAWDLKLGDVMEELLGADIAKACGQGWLGENTIGPKFHEPGTIERIATEAARGVGDSYGASADTLGLSAMQLGTLIHGLIGIPASLDRRGGKNAPKKLGKTDTANRAKIVLSAVAGLLLQHEPEDLAGDLDLIGDFDEILSPGAAERLGIKDQVVIDALVSSYADAANKREWANVVVREAQNLSAAGEDTGAVVPPFSDAPVGGPPPAAETPAGTAELSVAPPLPTEHVRKARPGKNTVTNPQAQQALCFLIDSGMSHQALATLLGISKSSIHNYQSGKSPFAPNSDEIMRLRQAALDQRNGLDGAIEKLDVALLE